MSYRIRFQGDTIKLGKIVKGKWGRAALEEEIGAPNGKVWKFRLPSGLKKTGSEFWDFLFLGGFLL